MAAREFLQWLIYVTGFVRFCVCYFENRQNIFSILKPSHLRGTMVFQLTFQALLTEFDCMSCFCFLWLWNHSTITACRIMCLLPTHHVVCFGFWESNCGDYTPVLGCVFFTPFCNRHIIFSIGFAGEDWLRTSASVSGHIWMETHLCAANSCSQD